MPITSVSDFLSRTRGAKKKNIDGRHHPRLGGLNSLHSTLCHFIPYMLPASSSRRLLSSVSSRSLSLSKRCITTNSLLLASRSHALLRTDSFLQKKICPCCSYSTLTDEVIDSLEKEGPSASTPCPVAKEVKLSIRKKRRELQKEYPENKRKSETFLIWEVL